MIKGFPCFSEKGEVCFPSWTSSVRIRSPAFIKHCYTSSYVSTQISSDIDNDDHFRGSCVVVPYDAKTERFISGFLKMTCVRGERAMSIRVGWTSVACAQKRRALRHVKFRGKVERSFLLRANGLSDRAMGSGPAAVSRPVHRGKRRGAG